MRLNGEINSDTTAPMRVIARIYSKLGRLDEAVQMQNKVIKIRELLWGKNQFKYFEQLETLADIYIENDKKQEGRQLLVQALELIGDRTLQYEIYVKKLRAKIETLK